MGLKSEASRLEDVFRESLNLDKNIDVRQFRYRQNPEWDSVSHLRIVNNLENEFQIQLTTEQILNMNSFSVALSYVTKQENG